MSNYRQTKAKLHNEKSPNSDTKISTALTDKLLAALARFKLELSDIELRLIMKTNPTPRCFDDCEIMDDRKRLMVIRTKIDMKGLKIPCEFKSCASKRPMIPIYLGQCSVCSHRVKNLLDSATAEGQLRFDLLTVRCLLIRVSYLEEQLNVAEQLTKSESETIRNEAEVLANL